MGIKMEDKEIFKIIADIDPSNSGHITFFALQPIIVEYQVERIMGSDEDELLDAYVAMGGEADGGGCVVAESKAAGAYMLADMLLGLDADTWQFQFCSKKA